jgi:hypothetical protein
VIASTEGATAKRDTEKRTPIIDTLRVPGQECGASAGLLKRGTKAGTRAIYWR